MNKNNYILPLKVGSMNIMYHNLLIRVHEHEDDTN